MGLRYIYIPWTILICFGKDYIYLEQSWYVLEKTILRPTKTATVISGFSPRNGTTRTTRSFCRKSSNASTKTARRVVQGDLSSDRTLVVGVFECACLKYQPALWFKHHTMMTRVDLVWLSGVGPRLTMKNGTQWLVICSTYIRDLCQGVVSWRWTNWSKVLARTARKCEIWPNEYYVVITHMWFP